MKRTWRVHVTLGSSPTEPRSYLGTSGSKRAAEPLEVGYRYTIVCAHGGTQPTQEHSCTEGAAAGSCPSPGSTRPPETRWNLHFSEGRGAPAWDPTPPGLPYLPEKPGLPGLPEKPG